jgi:hypothetical protein
MKARKPSNASGSFSLKLAFVYLLFSFLASLAFSILAFKRRSKGKGGWGWIILSLICAVLFGTISYSLVITSSPALDSGWYYLGMSTLCANVLSVLVLLISLSKRN